MESTSRIGAKGKSHLEMRIRMLRRRKEGESRFPFVLPRGFCVPGVFSIHDSFRPKMVDFFVPCSNKVHKGKEENTEFPHEELQLGSKPILAFTKLPLYSLYLEFAMKIKSANETFRKKRFALIIGRDLLDVTKEVPPLSPQID